MTALNTQLKQDPFLALKGRLQPGDAFLALDWKISTELDVYQRQGIKVEMLKHSDRDFRLLTLPKDHYAAAVWEDGTQNFKLEEVQRILQILFSGLKPNATLYFGFSNRTLTTQTDDMIHSLIRQSGFSFEGEFRIRKPEGDRVMWSLRTPVVS